jgi:hypothetical protein
VCLDAHRHARNRATLDKIIRAANGKSVSARFAEKFVKGQQTSGGPQPSRRPEVIAKLNAVTAAKTARDRARYFTDQLTPHLTKYSLLERQELAKEARAVANAWSKAANALLNDVEPVREAAE